MGARAKCNYLSGVNLLKYLNIYFVIIDEYGLWCVLCVCFMCVKELRSTYFDSIAIALYKKK